MQFLAYGTYPENFYLLEERVLTLEEKLEIFEKLKENYNITKENIHYVHTGENLDLYNFNIEKEVNPLNAYIIGDFNKETYSGLQLFGKYKEKGIVLIFENCFDSKILKYIRDFDPENDIMKGYESHDLENIKRFVNNEDFKLFYVGY